MKKGVFFVLFLVPFFCKAQEIQLSLMGGASLSNIKDDPLYSYKNLFSPNGRLKVTINTRIISFGVSADIFNITTKGEDLIVHNGFTFTPLSPALTFSLFAEKQLSIGKSIVFGGIHIGYLFSNSYEFNEQKMDRETRGYSIGIQLGATVPVFKKISFISELSPRYISATTKGETDAFVIPLDVGLCYSF